MAAERQDAARWMTLRYGVALLVIALCAIVGFVMTERVIVEHAGMAEVMNISGRQRMLSQRTAMLVERLLHAATPGERAGLIRQLSLATDSFEATHRRLTGPGPDSLNDAVADYISALRQVIAAAPLAITPDMPAVRHVRIEAAGPILEQLEAMVARYQERGEAAFDTLHRLGAVALLLTLVTLTLEMLVVFRPMTRQVQHQFTEIGRITGQLRAVNENLEEQVRQRTQELAIAKEEAEKANQAKSRFLAAAGHDLLQPLQAISMFTGLLERMVDGARGRAILRDLRRALNSMRGLLDSLLDITRIEAGAVAARPEQVALAPLLDQLAAEFGPQAESKGLALRVIPSSAWVHTDPALLLRILRNFLSNAVRYTESGCILIGGRRTGSALRLEVHDTGRGIPEADRRRIFEEFIQLDAPDRDRSEGIGLGLAIADRLARLLEHPLGIRSTEGRGAVFSVTVPVVARRSMQPVAAGSLDQ
ncbi:MAG TPA: ATP-binding protein [Azospirillaceae bacterium]|nr:ATP-binding protein [Azospirillaceae bacterium]